MYTDDFQVLLLKRVLPFEFWQSITGSLDADELPADAAARELVEETGLADASSLIDTGTSRTFTIDPRWRDRYAPGITENREHEFRLCLPTPISITADPSEHSDWQWVPLEEAIGRVWSWTNRAALEALRPA